MDRAADPAPSTMHTYWDSSGGGLRRGADASQVRMLLPSIPRLATRSGNGFAVSEALYALIDTE